LEGASASTPLVELLRQVGRINLWAAFFRFRSLSSKPLKSRERGSTLQVCEGEAKQWHQHL
jgi:hypothetical protein